MAVTMYLGMTEEDYDSVIKLVPINVADRLGIQSAPLLAEEDLKNAIRQADETAFTLMQDFLATYQAWWQKSKEVGAMDAPTSNDKERVISLIDRRDEIRRALLNYLNYARMKNTVVS
jgi:hypothetical protein